MEPANFFLQFIKVSSCEWCNITFLWSHHWHYLIIVHQLQHVTSIIMRKLWFCLSLDLLIKNTKFFMVCCNVIFFLLFFFIILSHGNYYFNTNYDCFHTPTITWAGLEDADIGLEISLPFGNFKLCLKKFWFCLFLNYWIEVTCELWCYKNGQFSTPLL